MVDHDLLRTITGRAAASRIRASIDTSRSKGRRDADIRNDSDQPGWAGAIARGHRVARVGLEIDYGVRPHADPYFWASFVLMGDRR